MQKILLCKDNAEAFLTAVFEAYKLKNVENIITAEIYQSTIDTEIVKVEADEACAQRVKNAIIKNGGREVYENLKYAVKSGDNFKGVIILKFIRKLLKEGKTAVSELQDPIVSSFYNLAHKVKWEVHRMLGLIRFSETASGIFYACYSPDNSVTEYLMPHFTTRCNNMDFIIHDVSRNILGVYSSASGEWCVTEYDGGVYMELSKDEEEVRKRFKDYFLTVNIKERKNSRQQNGYLPKRYRKDLPEFK